MQKKISISIFSIFVLLLISVLTTVILMPSYSYSRNSDNNNNNVISILLAIPTHGNYDISTATSFLTYQDPVYGIKIQYPSDWEKIKLDKNFIVGFVSPSDHDSGVLENVMISADQLSPQLYL
jgi:hypothetical protein